MKCSTDELFAELDVDVVQRVLADLKRQPVVQYASQRVGEKKHRRFRGVRVRSEEATVPRFQKGLEAKIQLQN